MEAYSMAKKKRNPANAAVLAHIFENYEIKSVLDIQEALKDMFGGAMEQMLAGELDAHLGYDRHENAAQTTNRRNGSSAKTVRSQLGELEIDIPRDREASFDPNSSQSIRRMFCRLKTACWRCMRKGNPNGISPLPFRTSTASISATKPFLRSPNGLSRWSRSLETVR